MKRLLAGAEGSNPPADFIAQVAMADRRETGDRQDVSATFHRRRPNRGYRWKAGFEPAIGIRRFSGDGLHERHRLRNQEIAFLLPRHAAPQPERYFGKKPIIIQAMDCAKSRWKNAPSTESLRK
ncbi:hypothetical protein [Bradyrhizobium sp.]|uniref:hypothetical protein n=1 Tax=Bradyrhizobium sp. TaxID=376 RepID=UPI003C6EC450